MIFASSPACRLQSAVFPCRISQRAHLPRKNTLKAGIVSNIGIATTLFTFSPCGAKTKCPRSRLKRPKQYSGGNLRNIARNISLNPGFVRCSTIIIMPSVIFRAVCSLLQWFGKFMGLWQSWSMICVLNVWSRFGTNTLTAACAMKRSIAELTDIRCYNRRDMGFVRIIEDIGILECWSDATRV